MLKIQEFIAQHVDWEQLLQQEPYYLRIKWQDCLVMFNYTQCKSKPCDIVNEARGLILDASNGMAVVRRGFDRFYNYGETGAATIDWEHCYVQEKIDGTLIMFYFYGGQWRASTRATFDASEANVYDTGLTFNDLVCRALTSSGVDFSQFNPRYTYVFELVSPESRVVIAYSHTSLYYLMQRDNETGEEFYAPCEGWLCPEFYFYKTTPIPEQVKSFVSQFEGAVFEGVVVRDIHGNRVKVKNMNWITIHHIASTNRMSETKALELHLSGDLDEFLVFYPEYTELAQKIVDKYERVLFWAEYVDKQNYKEKYVVKRDFAIMVQKSFIGGWKPLMFNAWDKKAVKWVKSLDAEHFMKFFRAQ